MLEPENKPTFPHLLATQPGYPDGPKSKRLYLFDWAWNYYDPNTYEEYQKALADQSFNIQLNQFDTTCKVEQNQAEHANKIRTYGLMKKQQKGKKVNPQSIQKVPIGSTQFNS